MSSSATTASASATPILRVAVPTPLRRSFDYLPPEDVDLQSLAPGIRVKVPFGRRTVVGLLVECAADSELETARLRRASEVLDSEPLLPPTLLHLCQWAAAYYQHPLGEVLHTVLPVALRQGKPARIRSHASDRRDSAEEPAPEQPPRLNSGQQQAVHAINERDGFACYLLDGITGSGKTEVYLRAIAHRLEAGRQALILVPEISLTPQTIARFRRRFRCPISLLHSGLTPRQRLNAWLEAARGDSSIIIGTRSAVFTPMARPGMIIVDEEHDSSFKQQDGFRYSARDLAVMRAHAEGMPIVLGAATPSLASQHKALTGRYTQMRQPQRTGVAELPPCRLLDINDQVLQEGFSPQLLDMIGAHLEHRGQVLVFINRRGFAPVLQCEDCAWVAECEHCDARLTIHRHPPHLRCHHCDQRQPLVRHCPACHSRRLQPLGLGTERSEQFLQSLFPTTRVIRVDRDSTRRRDALDHQLEEISQQQPCILVGTQMLAKGHHFPGVSLVAVIDADGGLFSADFRGQEQMGQLLIQVAGRAGRAERPGEVIIQTRHSDHHALQTLVNEGYHRFAEDLLAERRAAEMPPFTYLALIRAEAVAAAAPGRFLQALRTQAESMLKDEGLQVQLTGPLPSPMEKRAGRFRAQLLLRSARRADLHRLLDRLAHVLEADRRSRRVRWSMDVDPLDML